MVIYVKYIYKTIVTKYTRISRSLLFVITSIDLAVEFIYVLTALTDTRYL